MRKIIIILVILFLISTKLFSQNYQIALLKYGGGGDWYADPTALPNLVAFCNEFIQTSISTDIAVVEPGSEQIFNYPFIHMTGHGNVVFTEKERENLRNYLLGGGFLHIDDNYGMDPFIRPQLQLLFPELELLELPSSHAIYNQKYTFSKGIPKIHEHDTKAPQAFGLFYEGRLILLYTYETDLSDGWEDQSVHQDSQQTRLKALQMGANIIQYVFTQ